MDRRDVITTTTFVLLGLAFLGNVMAQTLTQQVDIRLRQRLAAGERAVPLRVAGEPIYATWPLVHFYTQRGYRSAWSDEHGLLRQTDGLVQAIHEAMYEGLELHDYHVAAIEAILAASRQRQARQEAFDPERLADLDLLLSDAFLTYGTHLLGGHLHPQGSVHDNPSAIDLVNLLQHALDTDQIRAALHRLSPPHAGYMRLRQALARYRQIAAEGGWPLVEAGPSLHLGDRDERLLALRTRLRITGDLKSQADTGKATLFDAAVERAVRAFQRRHGLDADGVVGPATREALNIPVEVRLRQIVRNLERWRRFPHHPGHRYILVNIPNFSLDVIEYGQSVLHMRVVVGKPRHSTPVFSDTMTYLVLSPYWQVPASIARREILPRLRQNPDYLAILNLKVFQGWGATVQEIDPQTIDWSAVAAKRFHYRLRQEPGPHNALGRVKFMFPNRYNVYMHDTPARSLFAKSTRAFSHGCIRLENPLALAEYVLRSDPRWSRMAILAAMARGVERYVRLPEAIPVHLVYRTAWVDSEGKVQFRADIYGYDKPLEASFCGTTPCG